MTHQAHLLGAVLMVIIMLLLAPVVFRWTDSPLLFIAAFIVLLVPVFVASHWLADVLLSRGETPKDARTEAVDEESEE